MLRLIIILIFSFFLLPSFVVAEPEIIFDTGRTTSTMPYRKMLTDSQVPDFGESWFLNKMPKSSDPKNPETWFPITTTRMSPKRLENESEIYLTQLPVPICIIGTDELSIEWLRLNIKHLIEINAQCWLVQANHIDEVKMLSKILKSVSITPANGDAISRYFKIKHYPVLITDRYVYQ